MASARLVERERDFLRFARFAVHHGADLVTIERCCAGFIFHDATLFF